MKPMELSQNKLARDLDVPIGRINEIIHGDRAITADTALRLAVYFGTSPGFWLNLQTRFDLNIIESKHGVSIRKSIRPIRSRAAYHFKD